MPILEPQTREVTQWQGYHLCHYGMSYCSQRVRILLEEYRIDWHSHIIDIPKGENLSSWYRGIHPQSLVPALVHNGRVVTESVDILHYLQLQNHRARGASTAIEPEAETLIAMIDQYQSDIKVLSFQYLFNPFSKKKPHQLRQLEQRLNNPELLEFHRRFSSPEGLPETEINQAIEHMFEGLMKLEHRLRTHNWLSGDAFGLADICWSVNIHRLAQLSFPLQHFPALSRWYHALLQRPSFKKAVLSYEPGLLVKVLRLNGWMRARWGRYRFDRILRREQATGPSA